MHRKPQPRWITVSRNNWQQAIKQAGECLQNEGVVIHATETVYGLAARWDREVALKRVAQIKGRALQQPFSIMVSTVDQILQIEPFLPPQVQQFLQQLFPAPVTVLLPRSKALPVSYWNQFPLIGFRLPDHKLSRELVVAAGSPLITTSANFSGQPSPKKADDIPKELIQRVDLILDSGPTAGGVPSTIVEISKNWQELTLVREGPVSLEKILTFFQKNL